MVNLNITAGVQNLLGQAHNQKETTLGYLLAGKSKDEWNSNTAIITDKISDIILGSKEYATLNNYLKETSDAKIIPFVTCTKTEDAKPFLQSANENNYNLCIILTGNSMGVYQTKNQEIQKGKMRIVPRIDKQSEETINELMDIIIAEHKKNHPQKK